MDRYRKWFRRLSLVAVGTAVWASGIIGAAEPESTEPPNPIPAPIQLVQQPPPTIQPPPTVQPPPNVTPPQGQQASDAGAGSSLFGGLPTTTNAVQGTETAPRTTTTPGPTASVPLAGGNAAPVLNAPDLGELLSKSPQAAGVDVQRRNAVISDPRIRGYHVGQFFTLGDGALFFPARQDLDTAIAKFDPGSVRDIVVYKGPYTSLLGPAFAFLDVATLDSPRYNCFETHGRTSLGFQTNGAAWDGLQSVFVGDKDWGFRATYNGLAGNDYRAGNGQDIAASYNSNNVNWALGVDLTPNSKLEFKGLRVHQQNLEFPGLYFDIARLDTEAYNLRYTVINQPYFDRFNIDVWYNTTTADGNTTQFAKQSFVQQLLNASFNFPTYPIGVIFPPPPILVGPLFFKDFSTTNFNNKSLGYRAAMSWGDNDKGIFTAGSDLNVLGQSLAEHIRILQTDSRNGAVTPILQNQGIPDSSWIDPGLFIELSLPVSDRTKVKAGSRVDFVNTSSDPRLITGNVDIFGLQTFPGGTPNNPNRFVVDPIIYSTNPNDPSLDRNFPLFSAFMTSEYKIDEHYTALAAMGYAERAPTLTELYATGPFIGVLQQGTSRLIGDPNLEKPKLSQFDVGVKADYEWFHSGVNGFYAVIDDAITYDANKLGAGITQVVYTNTDRATYAGGEMYAVMEATSWLTPFGNFAYVQGIDQTHTDWRRPLTLASSRRNNIYNGEHATATEPLPQIPPWDMRTGFRIHDPLRKVKQSPRWTVEFSAHIVQTQNNVATSLGELPTAGYTIFDIRSFWQVNDKWLLSAGVENLGDRQYRAHLDPISGNILSVDPLYRPGTNFYFASQFTY